MKKQGRKGSDQSKLSHRSETVRALSGEGMTTARGGLKAQCGDTCGGGSGQVSCSHTCYYCQTSGNDW